MWQMAAGAGLGALGGLMKPKVPTMDLAAMGIGQLTGTNEERGKAFTPIHQRMQNIAQKGTGLGAAELARQAAPARAQAKSNLLGIKGNINERGIGTGVGVGGGMQQAAHLKAGIAGLHADRGITTQLASADAAGRADRMVGMQRHLSGMYQQDQRAGNEGKMQEWQHNQMAKRENDTFNNVMQGAIGGAGMGMGMG